MNRWTERIEAGPDVDGDEVLGSVALGCSPRRLKVLNQPMLIELLKTAAAQISTAIEGISHPQTPVMKLTPATLRKVPAIP